MQESQIQTKIIKWIKKTYPDAWVWKISDKWYSGVPDLMVINDTRHIFIEIKQKKGRLTPLQHYTIKAIINAGGEAHVARSVDDVREIIEKGGVGK